jgi:hypothetical protein
VDHAAPCAAASASSTCSVTTTMLALSSPRRDSSPSGAPSTNSMTMYGRPSAQPGQVEHVDDVLVADEVDRARLGEEALDQRRVTRALGGQHLDRDPAADLRAARPCRPGPCRPRR